jgi:hypothetical protein
MRAFVWFTEDRDTETELLVATVHRERELMVSDGAAFLGHKMQAPPSDSIGIPLHEFIQKILHV